MSPIKWLNILLFIENLLGIYRNYSSQREIKKYLIKLQIIVQTALHAILIVYEVNFLSEKGGFNQIKLIFATFGSLACVNAMSSVAVSICYSWDFMCYYSKIKRISDFFVDDNQLKTSLRKVFCVGATFNMIFYVFATLRTTQALIRFSPSNSILLVPVLVSQAMIRFTIVYQHLMVFMVVMIVLNLFKCLTSLISAVQESVASCDTNLDAQCDITKEQIQGCVELYRDIGNCCEKITLCFGRQYFVSLVLSISQYIFLTYQMFYMKVFNYKDSNDGTRIALMIFSYISVMVMPLVAGQMMSNQGKRFHRVLVRLYNTTIIDSGEAEAKSIKDFIRLIKKNPIEIKLLTNLPVGMYMMPIVSTLTVNYIIFMLQFNDII